MLEEFTFIAIPCWRTWLTWMNELAEHATWHRHNMGAEILSANQSAPNVQWDKSKNSPTGYKMPSHCTAGHEWVRPHGLHVTSDKTPIPCHENALWLPCQTYGHRHKQNWRSDRQKQNGGLTRLKLKDPNSTLTNRQSVLTITLYKKSKISFRRN